MTFLRIVIRDSPPTCHPKTGAYLGPPRAVQSVKKDRTHLVARGESGGNHFPEEGRCSDHLGQRPHRRRHFHYYSNCCEMRRKKRDDEEDPPAIELLESDGVTVKPFSSAMYSSPCDTPPVELNHKMSRWRFALTMRMRG